MYKCEDCGKVFDEPARKEVCLELEYGVSDLFDNYHYDNVLCCPNCMSDQLKDLEHCECCGEYVESLIDTEGMLNGGIGCICEQCCIDNSITE